MAINDFDAGGRPSANWQRFSTAASGFGRGAASASGILDAFSEMFAQIAASDRPESSQDSIRDEDPQPSGLADDDASSAESEHDFRDTKPAEPRLELPGSTHPESAASVTPERSPTSQQGLTTHPVESNDSASGDTAALDSVKKRPASTTGPNRAADADTLPEQAVDDLDAARGRRPNPDQHDPRIHPDVAELEPRRREGDAVVEPRPAASGEEGRGGEPAAGRPVDPKEGPRHGQDQSDQGDQGGLFSESDRHDDRRGDRRDRSADEPLAIRDPSQNRRAPHIKPLAAAEAAMAAANANPGTAAEAADGAAPTATQNAGPSQPLPMNPVTVAAAESSNTANGSKASSPATAADSVKSVEGRPGVDDGRPTASSGLADSSGRREARTGTGNGADGRDGGTDAVSRAKLVQRVSRAFHQLGGSGGIVRMRLAPAELGSVRIEMRVQDRRVDARVVAESEAAGQILRDHLPELRQRLEAQGMKVERIEVRTEQESSADSGPDFGRDHRRDPDQDRGQTPYRERWGRPEIEPAPPAKSLAPPSRLPPVVSPLRAAGVDVRW